MTHVPARLAVAETDDDLTARVRPQSNRQFWLAVGGIALGLLLAWFADVVPLLCRVSVGVKVVAAFLIAVMFRRLVYFLGGFVWIHADRAGIRLRHDFWPFKKFFPVGSLTVIGLTEAEGAPLAGVNMGPLGGSLWCECGDRYVCFARGLSESDAKLLAAKINAAIGKG